MNRIVADRPRQVMHSAPNATARATRVPAVALGIFATLAALGALGAPFAVIIAAATGVLAGVLFSDQAEPGDTGENVVQRAPALPPPDADTVDTAPFGLRLRRRDARIGLLKRRLAKTRAAGAATIASRDATIASQREIIAGLEEALLTAADTTQPSRRDTDRADALEHDLAAMNTVVESLQSDVDYWRRRAAH